MDHAAKLCETIQDINVLVIRMNNPHCLSILANCKDWILSGWETVFDSSYRILRNVTMICSDSEDFTFIKNNKVKIALSADILQWLVQDVAHEMSARIHSCLIDDQTFDTFP